MLKEKVCDHKIWWAEQWNSEQKMKLKVILWDLVDKSNPSEVMEPQMSSCLKTRVCLKSSNIWTC